MAGLGKAFAMIMIALFAFFFLAGVFKLTSHIALLRNHETSHGSVVRLKEVWWHPSSPTGMGSNAPDIYAIVQFADKHGAVHEFQSSQASYPAIYKVGDTVTVLYSEGQSGKPLIYSTFELWFEPFIFIMLGSLPLLLLRKKSIAENRFLDK